MRKFPAVAAAAVLLLLTGCGQFPGETLEPVSTPGADGQLSPVQPVGTPHEIVSGLQAPWSIVRLESGSTLISERDRGVVVELTSDGALRDVGAIEGVVHDAEAGLLGLAVLDNEWLYAYFSTASDNRIERFELQGEAGSYALGAGEEILTGLAHAPYHNGGRIAFGPDGMLYATVGDATDLELSQDKDSLNGKILRMTPEGEVPDGNPFDSLVYSMGHRNPQGLAWDDDGQLWASEFGQDVWDELNRIEPGGNYGWPIAEGRNEALEYINPVLQWGTQNASPSGLLFSRGTFFMACLRGEKLMVVYPNGESRPNDVEYFEREYGRIRDVVAGPDGSIWFITNNTDGRGDPGEGDDKIWQVELDVMHEG